jgi:hypothetical protein
MNDYIALKSNKGQDILAGIIVDSILEVNKNGL